jgi:hypothetical protein
MHMLKNPLRRRLTVALSLLCLLASLTVAGLAQAKARAHVSGSYLTGIGDQQAEMFSDPLWQQLHTKIVRYIVPYDVVSDRKRLSWAKQWIAAAESQHQRILVAFYHSFKSVRSATRLPSVGAYQRDVKAFVKLFPHIREYQAWDEANRGNVAKYFSSPSAAAAAKYYRALAQVCRGCTVVGLDILDQQSVRPTLRYIAAFKREVAHLKTKMPTVWGLHNYSDTNRFQSTRTRAIVSMLPGQVWLTETGGIVKFGGAFPNRKGSGLRRAAKALSYMFRLASSNSRIKRLYIFQWSGSGAKERFDAGLTDLHFKPRPGYVVVCQRLRAAKCRVKTSSR